MIFKNFAILIHIKYVFYVYIIDSNQTVLTNSNSQKSDRQADKIYTKRSKSIPIIVKPSAANDEGNFLSSYDNEDEFERTKHTSNINSVR